MSDKDMSYCDYCGVDLPTYFSLRAVGMDGNRVIVKAWCDCCPVPSDIDPEADLALTTAFDPAPLELGS